MNQRIRNKHRKQAEELIRAAAIKLIGDNEPWEFETAEYVTKTFPGGAACGPRTIIYKSKTTEVRVKVNVDF